MRGEVSLFLVAFRVGACLNLTATCHAFMTPPASTLRVPHFGLAQPSFASIIDTTRIHAFSLPTFLPSPSSPLVSAADDYGNASAVLLCATLAQLLGKTTALGKLLGPPVTAMTLTFFFASVGIMPPGGSAGASSLQSLTLNLATPLLLLGADIRAARRSCGPLLISFVLASLATVLGSVAAINLGPIRSMLTAALGTDGLKVAAALMAKNIGGGINYFAVCAALGASTNAIAAGICVDNIFALLYFPLSSALGSGRPDPSPIASDDDDIVSGGEVTVERVSVLIALSTTAAWFGRLIGGKANALPVSTLLTLLGTTLVPSRWIAPLRPTGEILGTALLYVFFATAGTGGLAIGDSVRAAFWPIGIFLTILYGVHGCFLATSRQLVLKYRLRLQDGNRCSKDEDEGMVAPQRLLVASSAAIGGPATAAALANANGWKSLVTPSLLVGNLGYAVATFAAIAFYRLL